MNTTMRKPGRPGRPGPASALDPVTVARMGPQAAATPGRPGAGARLNWGPAIPRADALAYRAADPSRLRREYRSSLGSGEYVLWRDRENVRDFSRRMYLLSAEFVGFIDRMVEVVLGSGLRPMAQDDAAVKAVEMFERWGEEAADARGMEGFEELQRMALRAMLIDGDIGVAPDSRMGLNFVESERIQSPGGKRFDNSKIADGVEMDARGRAVAFHVSEYDPSGAMVMPDTRRVPADRFWFLSRRTRPSATRGLPILATACDRFAGLEEYVDAVQAAAQIHAMFAAVVTSESPQQFRSALATGTETTTGADGSARVNSLASLAPGTILTLGTNEKIMAMQGSQPTAQFDQFVRAMLNKASAVTGLPLEVAVLDNTRVNFSTARMAQIQADNAAKPMRRQFVRNFCDRVYRWFVAQMVLRGELRADGGLLRIEWVTPARQLLDPMKEYQALAFAVGNNLMSHEAALLSISPGMKFAKLMEQRKYEMDLQRTLGILPTKAGIEGGAPTTDDIPKKDEPSDGASPDGGGDAQEGTD